MSPSRLAGVVLAAALSLCAAPKAGAAEPYKPEGGSLSVDVQTATWTDTARKRDIPVRIFAPIPAEGEGPYPLIVFSHGFGETRYTYGHLATHWASHGYVVVVANHAGTDKTALLASRAGDRGALAPFDVRPADISFVITKALDGSGEKLLAGRIDGGKIGVGGHSLGSTTALAIAGLTRYLDDGRSATYRDPRVRAAIAMSVQVGTALDEEAKPGALEVGLTKGSWDTVETPTMIMIGTKDIGLGILRDRPELREVVYESLPPGDKYLVNIKDARHHAFTDTPAYYDTAPRDPRHYFWINEATTAFYDAYLKGSAEARAWLTTSALSELTDGEVIQKSK